MYKNKFNMHKYSQKTLDKLRDFVYNNTIVFKTAVNALMILSEYKAVLSESRRLV